MEIIVTRRSDPNYQRTFKKIRKKKIKEAADISALRARMKAEMDKVAKHRDDVKKHSGKFVDKAKNALKRQKAAQARVDALQDRIIGIKRENVKAALKEGKYHDWRNDDSLSAKQKIGLSMREVKGALDEIDKLIKADLNTKAQKRARELFVFALYTGLSYSDVIQLKVHQIQIAKDNTKYILKKRKKSVRVKFLHFTLIPPPS